MVSASCLLDTDSRAIANTTSSSLRSPSPTSHGHPTLFPSERIRSRSDLQQASSMVPVCALPNAV